MKITSKKAKRKKKVKEEWVRFVDTEHPMDDYVLIDILAPFSVVSVLKQESGSVHLNIKCRYQEFGKDGFLHDASENGLTWLFMDKEQDFYDQLNRYKNSKAFDQKMDKLLND